MTDLSKINLGDLKLEPFGRYRISVQRGETWEILAGDTVVARHFSRGWALASGAEGLDKEETNELWKRTEQVDEFIRQQSRRRITVLELIRELVNTGREISIITGSTYLTYRLNLDHCSVEYIDTGLLKAGYGDWSISVHIGKHSDIVTVLD